MNSHSTDRSAGSSPWSDLVLDGQLLQCVSPEVPSRPGEFHPESLTDPDLNLSIYPARATARRLPPSVDKGAPLGEPIGP